MNMLKKGFEMPYYLDQLMIRKDEIISYQGEAWAPSNSSHMIQNSLESYWCFEVEGNKIYCLGLFSVSGEYGQVAPRNEFHDVTHYMKDVFFQPKSDL